MTYHPRGKIIQGYTCKKHPLYNTWVLLKQRCNNPNNFAYKHYGGRGIKICKRWESFENFALDMGLKPTSKHSLERINNNKGYSPSNCKWATVEEQRLNRRCFKNSESGHTGIRVLKNGLYQAIAHFNKVRYYIGQFTTLEKAVSARKKFVTEKTRTTSS